MVFDVRLVNESARVRLIKSSVMLMDVVSLAVSIGSKAV